MTTRILVTGASGFIGSHCVLDLLNHGYQVRGSLRNLARGHELETMLQAQGANTERLDWVQASLTSETDWHDAVKDCDGIFHIASPVPTVQPKDPDEVIGPARAGTLNVLNAASSAGVRRVVLTSSVAAVMGGKSEDRVYTANDWSDPDDPDMNPYGISKTVAEHAAWDHCKEYNISLTTILPALVLGPTMEKDYGSSLEAIVKLMKREVPLLPKFGFEIVDVRDVAQLHRLAFENDAAIGKRLIAANGFLWFREIAAILHGEYPGQRVPQHEMPNWLSYVASFFVKEIGSFINDLGVEKQLDISPARELGWTPRVPSEAILSGAQSLKDLGLV